MLPQSSAQNGSAAVAKPIPAPAYSKGAVVPTVNSVALLGSYSGLAAFNTSEQAKVSNVTHVIASRYHRNAFLNLEVA